MSLAKGMSRAAPKPRQSLVLQLLEYALAGWTVEVSRSTQFSLPPPVFAARNVRGDAAFDRHEFIEAAVSRHRMVGRQVHEELCHFIEFATVVPFHVCERTARHGRRSSFQGGRNDRNTSAVFNGNQSGRAVVEFANQHDADNGIAIRGRMVRASKSRLARAGQMSPLANCSCPAGRTPSAQFVF